MFFNELFKLGQPGTGQYTFGDTVNLGYGGKGVEFCFAILGNAFPTVLFLI